MKSQTANIIIMTPDLLTNPTFLSNPPPPGRRPPLSSPFYYCIALPQGESDPLGSDRQPIDMKPSTDHLMQSMAIGYPGPRTKMDGNNQKDDQ